MRGKIRLVQLGSEAATASLQGDLIDFETASPNYDDVHSSVERVLAERKLHDSFLLLQGDHEHAADDSTPFDLGVEIVVLLAPPATLAADADADAASAVDALLAAPVTPLTPQTPTAEVAAAATAAAVSPARDPLGAGGAGQAAAAAAAAAAAGRADGSTELTWQQYAELDARVKETLAIARKDSVRHSVRQPSAVRPDVLIIGAGPVGLWTAIQIKLLVPSAELLMIEKYAEYQRRHLLRLNHRSLRGAPADPRLRKLCAALPAAVRTSELESRLLALADELGIHIHIDTTLDQYPTARVLIGADGSHSVVRKQVFGDKLRVNQTLEHIADLKYEVQGRGERLKFHESYRVLKLLDFLAEETVGREHDGRTPVTLRLIIDPPAFERVKDASFKAPFRLYRDAARLDPRMLRAAIVWLNAKAALRKEVRVPGSETLTAIRLSVYCAERVATEYHGRHCFLVGDAAFGVPFFRALNNGLLCGTELARSVAAILSGHTLKDVPADTDEWEVLGTDDTAPGSSVGSRAPASGSLDAVSLPEEPVARYEAYFRRLADREIAVARMKKSGLEVGHSFVKLNSLMPWQLVTLGPELRHRLFVTDPRFVAPPGETAVPLPAGTLTEPPRESLLTTSLAAAHDTSVGIRGALRQFGQDLAGSLRQLTGLSRRT